MPCDLTSEDFDLPIKGNEIVSSVWTHITNNEELLVLPFGEFELTLLSTSMK
jgi:hypothetical protein